MKRHSRILGSIIGLTALPLFLACNDPVGLEEENQPASVKPRLEISPSNAAIEVGETIRLRAILRGTEGEVLDSDYQVDWSSSKPEVLRVTETGYAIGIAQGSATITAEGVALSDRTRVSVRQGPVIERRTGDGDKDLPEDDREHEDREYK
jgi:hypothetical protein